MVLMAHQKEETTVILLKPDCLQRSILGEVLHRFERKGLRVIGLKMMQLDDVLLGDHYAHHKDKPFFDSLKRFMKSAPIVAVALSGINAIEATRFIVGSTAGYKADAGTIRGDFSISGQANIVHASDSKEAADAELKRFFKPEELFDYQKIDFNFVYGEEERSK
jgi:nucleoside-diphosphate kinase